MIAWVRIRSFRGISSELSLTLRNISVLSGRNGLGKTTIFEAIDWCLFGHEWKAQDEQDAIRHLYLPKLAPEVELELDLNGSRYRLTRTLDGPSIDGRRVTDRDVLQTFIRDSDLFPPYARDIELRIRRLSYLPQDEIRSLLRSDSSEERAAILQSILGVPNAQLLDSSIRRLEQRLTIRLRNLQGSLDEVHSAMQETLFQATPIAQHGAPDPDATVEHARRLLAPQTDRELPLAELPSLLSAEIRQCITQRALLDDLKSHIAEREARLESVRPQLAMDEATKRSLEAELIDQERALHEASLASNTGRSVMDQHSRSLGRALAELGALKRTLIQLRAAVEAHQEMLRSQARRSETEGRLLSAKQEVQHLEDRLASVRSVRETSLQIRTAVDRYLNLRGHLEQIDAAIFSDRERIGNLESPMPQTEAAIARLSEELAALLSRTPERVAAVLASLAELVETSSSSECPLCGAVYGSPYELAGHIRSKALALTNDAERIMILRRDLDRHNTTLTDARSAAGTIRQHAIDLEAQKVHVQSDLIAAESQLPRSPNPSEGAFPSDIAPSSSEELRLSTEEEARLLASLQEANHSFNTLQNEAAELMEAQAAGEQRFAILSAGATPTELTAKQMDIQDRLEQLGLIYAEAASSTERDARQQEELLANERRLLEATRQSKLELAAVQARVADAYERIQSFEADLLARTASILGPTIEPSSWHQAIFESAEKLRSRELQLRASLHAVEAILLLREQDDRHRHLSELRAKERTLLDQISILERARARFSAVSTTLTTRADEEAGKALHGLEDAAQYFLDALSRHRHLNQIKLHYKPADVLLFDAALAQPVRPTLYTSTGQLSVLAIALMLGISLRQRATYIDWLLMDEPIQNLDDLHFLSFISLIRRLAASRQVIVSTADSNVAELIRRQMKSSETSSQTSFVQYDWEDFDRLRGPIVRKVVEIQSAT